MKIVAINSLPNGSPATIMRGVLDVANKQYGMDCYSFYGNWKDCPKNYKGSCRFGFRIENYFSAIFERVTGIANQGAFFGTIILLSKINRIKPDVIHLHNIHLSVVNIPLLFNYIKRKNIAVIWTLHDCWAFTGRCPHFQLVKCNNWHNGCHDCPYPKNEYPRSYVDRSSYMYKKKKKWFLGVKELTIVTPSCWLASLVKESFLSSYPIEVIHNGIDLNVFRPIQSDYRNKFDAISN